MALGVEGVRVGMWTDPEHHTGCTVILPPAGTVGGIAVRGGAPGTRKAEDAPLPRTPPYRLCAARQSKLYGNIIGETPMHATNLRKVGGSVMLAVPPALLDVLKLKAGAKVNIGIVDGCLIVVPRARRHYSLDELLAQCDENAALSAEDRAWLDAKPVGNELL